MVKFLHPTGWDRWRLRRKKRLNKARPFTCINLGINPKRKSPEQIMGWALPMQWILLSNSTTKPRKMAPGCCLAAARSVSLPRTRWRNCGQTLPAPGSHLQLASQNGRHSTWTPARSCELIPAARSFAIASAQSWRCSGPLGCYQLYNRENLFSFYLAERYRYAPKCELLHRLAVHQS